MHRPTACLLLTLVGASCISAPNTSQHPNGALAADDPTAPSGAATATIVPKPGNGPVKVGGTGIGSQSGPPTTTLPTAADFVTSTGVPVSISLPCVDPDSPVGGPLALQCSGTIQMSGTFPVRYRIDFAAPAGHELECPAPIVGVATGPFVPFTATLRQRPAITEHYTIDAVVTIVDGANAGTRLRSAQGLVVYPDLPDTGKRGVVPGGQ